MLIRASVLSITGAGLDEVTPVVELPRHLALIRVIAIPAKRRICIQTTIGQCWPGCGNGHSADEKRQSNRSVHIVMRSTANNQALAIKKGTKCAGPSAPVKTVAPVRFEKAADPRALTQRAEALLDAWSGFSISSCLTFTCWAESL